MLSVWTLVNEAIQKSYYGCIVSRECFFLWVEVRVPLGNTISSFAPIGDRALLSQPFEVFLPRRKRPPNIEVLTSEF
jgi:hypothetical protein